MKCLSLWQPWSSLMACGAKRVETRGWPTHHRGPLLIHAAKKWNPGLAAVAASPRAFRPALEAAGVVFAADEGACRRGWNLPFGAILGVVEVVDCIPTDDCRSDADVNGWAFREGNWDREKAWVSPTERVFGDYAPNRYAWLCRNPVRFAEPIPYRGHQQLFDVPDDLIPTTHGV